ncbi:MAG TPA: glycosyltransferase family 4 protein [Candidatus Paceibacterota bacterium]
MHKKKVLFVITKGSPFGGAQKYVYDLATNTPPDFEAVVACGGNIGLPEALEQKGIRTVKIEGLVREIHFFDEFKVCWDLVKLFRKERPDVVHLNSSKIGGVGAVAGRIARVPKIIFTSHGWGFNEKHRSNLAKIFYALGHWMTLILVHRTIAVSEKTKKDASWMPFVSKKITVIHNGIGQFKLKTKKEARNILTGEEASKKIVVFSLSELHKNKGLDVALNGLSRLPEKIKEKILYCIAGDGEEKANLEKLVRDLGIESMVEFLGFIKDGRELLSGADIFLFPSRTENLPYAILEAGLTGLPIITTSVGGIPEVITNMTDGILVHPQSAREISEAIIYTIENREKVKQFKEKIRERVMSDFSIEKMREKTYYLYL